MKKKLTFVLCMVLVALISVGATLAYLQDSEAVKNTFTTGNVAITLDEAAVVYDETTNVYTENAEADRVQANTYKIYPGTVIAKDPTVTVKAGSEKCYVRMIVTISNAAVLGENLPEAYVDGWDRTVWVPQSVETVDGAMTVEFRYNGIVDAADGDVVLEDLFTTINVPAELDNEAMAALNNLTIDVEAHAIQAAGFADAAAAWTAFVAE